MANGKTCLVLLSGGLDSSTLAKRALREFDQVQGVFFNYGQRASHQEWLAARNVGIPLHYMNIILPGKASILRSSREPLLVGPNVGPVLEANWLPNRNAIFLANAYAIAHDFGYSHVGFAVHMGFSGQYFPDTSPAFCSTFQQMQNVSLGKEITLWTPYLTYDRRVIVQDAQRFGVDIGLTWSCYNDVPEPCGECGACIDREKAIVAVQ